MYKILFQNNVIGMTQLENGDPPMGCISGSIYNFGSLEEFTSFIVRCGGKQEQGVLYLELNEDFDVLTEENIKIPYVGGVGIRICWELNEAEIEIMGIPYPEYEYLFPEHVKTYKNQFS